MRRTRGLLLTARHYPDTSFQGPIRPSQFPCGCLRSHFVWWQQDWIDLLHIWVLPKLFGSRPLGAALLLSDNITDKAPSLRICCWRKFLPHTTVYRKSALPAILDSDWFIGQCKISWLDLHQAPQEMSGHTTAVSTAGRAVKNYWTFLINGEDTGEDIYGNQSNPDNPCQNMCQYISIHLAKSSRACFLLSPYFSNGKPYFGQPNLIEVWLDSRSGPLGNCRLSGDRLLFDLERLERLRFRRVLLDLRDVDLLSLLEGERWAEPTAWHEFASNFRDCEVGTAVELELCEFGKFGESDFMATNPANWLWKNRMKTFRPCTLLWVCWWKYSVRHAFASLVVLCGFSKHDLGPWHIFATPHLEKNDINIKTECRMTVRKWSYLSGRQLHLRYHPSNVPLARKGLNKTLDDDSGL